MLWCRSKDVFSWLVDAYGELNVIYKAIEFIYESNKAIEDFAKLLLGIKHGANKEEIAKRAKEFGEYYELFIKKAQELEFEQKEKEKWK